MQDKFVLSQPQAQQIMSLINLHGQVEVTLVNTYNHVFRIDCQDQSFFLKTHTKDWYPPEDVETGYSVTHEADAWAILAKHGLATPEILLAVPSPHNPYRRPFLLTRQVPGAPMEKLLPQVSEDEAREMLYAMGQYLGRMHAITFPYAGYIISAGPTAPPDDNYWQHPIWTLRQRHKSTQAWIEEHRTELSEQTLQQLVTRMQSMDRVLAPAYNPPHFTQGDCNISQPYVVQKNGKWEVSALLDMEVASAGDGISDLVTLCYGLARLLPGVPHWWETLFAGYGRVPAFEGFVLCLLCGWYPYEPAQWPGSGEQGFRHILQASNWEELFSLAHLPGISEDKKDVVK